MKAFFRIFVISLVFEGLFAGILTYGKGISSYLSFLSPGLDVFFSTVGGDNPILKVVVFFVFWFVAIFGFSWISYIILNTYVWTTNIGSEKKNPLEAILSASKKEIAVLVIGVDFVVLACLALYLRFRNDLSTLWAMGDPNYALDLKYFWGILFVIIFIFLVFMKNFIKKAHEMEELSDHLG